MASKIAELTDLRSDEILRIWRRRQRFNQEEAAKSLKVELNQYRSWENGEPIPEIFQIQIGDLELHEKCFLLRRRSGLLQRQLAKELGVSRLWLMKMEEGAAPVDRLRAYWNV